MTTKKHSFEHYIFYIKNKEKQKCNFFDLDPLFTEVDPQSPFHNNLYFYYEMRYLLQCMLML